MGIVRLPNDSQRLCIVGATGSGKTVALLWHLSRRSFDSIPWVVYDFKGDENIAQIQAPVISVYDDAPEHPGLYIVRPLPHEIDAVSDQMMSCWARGHTGIVVDEALMLGRNCRGFRTILTQGRSKRVSLIVGVQRPVDIDRFVFSESTFFQIFRLQSERDQKLLADFIPLLRNSSKNNVKVDFEDLPEHHSFYYDVGKNFIVELEAVPEAELVVEEINLRLESVRQVT